MYMYIIHICCKVFLSCYNYKCGLASENFLLHFINKIGCGLIMLMHLLKFSMGNIYKERSHGSTLSIGSGHGSCEL